MPVCLWSQPSCHVSLKFAGYSNPLNGDILKMSNLKLSQPGVIWFTTTLYGYISYLKLLLLLFTLQVVRRDRTLEKIVFPVPQLCEYLTETSKMNVYHKTERDDHNSKVC